MPRKSQKSIKFAPDQKDAKGPLKTVEPKAEEESKSPHAHHYTILVAAGIVVIVVAAIAIFLLLNYIAPKYLSQLPIFQNTSMPIPKQLSAISSQPAAVSTAQLSMLAHNSLMAIGQFSISYNGSIYIKPSGLAGSIATINSPLHVNESKYYSDTKLYINATSVPVLGSGEIVYLNSTSATLSCTNFNSSAISSHNYAKILFGQHELACSRSQIISGIDLGKLASFNLSALQYAGFEPNYGAEYQSSYKGTPCTYLSGTISESSSGAGSGSGLFNMCVSDKYYVPLSFSIIFNGSLAYVTANLNETQIGNYSRQSYVDSIPGPVTS